MTKYRNLFLVLVLLLWLATAYPTARAASFSVTTTADGNDGSCDAANCTLREAIAAANATAGADTITLAPGTYTLTLAGNGEDASATGDLDITEQLTLAGSGAATTIIDATGLGDRVLHVLAGAVNITDLTIQGGDVSDAGGGILNAAGSELSLASVVIRDNVAASNGGGLSAAGGLSLLNSTVADNRSGGAGGGLDVNLPPATGVTITIRSSTLSANSAGGDGGAIGVGTNTPLIVENSTLSGNSADENGGALRSWGSTTINASTLTNNQADADQNETGIGGAMFAQQGTVTYQSSIIAGNEAISIPDDCTTGAGSFSSQGYNLVGSGTGCITLATDQTVDSTIVFITILAPLADNGGPTPTHLLRSGSPAIDAVPGEVNGCGTSLLADQRGVARPQDGDGDDIEACDIGAVELAAAASAPTAPVILQATADGGGTHVLGRLSDVPATTFGLTFYSANSCDAAGPIAATTLLGSATATTDASGNVYFVADLPSSPGADQFVAAVAQRDGATSDFSICAAVGPHNIAWPSARTLSLSGDPLAPSASISQYLDRSGQSRWYKFSVQPNSSLFVTLTDLPNDYNLTLFKDIAAAYDASINSTEELLELNAEFAPEAFSPEAFSPEAFAPETFSPEAFSPEAFSPEAFSPLVFSPEAFSPEAFSPEAFAPEAFSPEAFSPEAFSPEAFSPEAFSPEAFSPEAFSPDAFSSAQLRSIIGVSAFSGLASEGLTLKTWNNSGDFYVRVSGRNGAFSLAAPFQLNVTMLSGACQGVSPALPATSLTVAGSHATLILTDWERMAGDPTALQSKLTALAARPEVNGAVVDVSADARVAAANAQADAYPECPYAKNLVADAIEQVIDSYWAQHSSLTYLVLVGNDDVIPFFRYPGQALLAPEQNYFPPVLDDTTSQASLRLNYVLSQDQYGSRVDLANGSSVLPVPELGVGRLVETPGEISTLVDAYLATSNGVVPTPSSALVTGYDFLWDAATAVQSEMEAGLGGSADTLLNPPDVSPASPEAWTADDLRTVLLDTRHDLIFLAGHFSAGGALAADYQTRLSAAEVASSSTNLTNALIFSAGCHSGYNVVNEHAVPGVTEALDWAQAFAQKGATFVGGTGYQYGDTDFVEYSERLYLNFAQQLRRGSGPVAVGQALAAAKAAYLADTPSLRGIHEKSLLQATLFGLPMLKVNLPAGRGTPSGDSSIVTSTSTFSSNPGAALGLRAADVTITPALSKQTVTLQNIESNSSVQATYWRGGDGVVTNPAEPVLPLEARNVSVANTVLRGVGFRGGSFADVPGVLPLTGAPATEIRGVHAPFLSSVFYPLRPWSVNYFDALADVSGSTRLVVTPVQHRTEGSTTLSTARRFDRMNFRLFYSNYTATAADGHEPALAAPPTIARTSSTVENGAVHFQVRVTGDPAAGIQGVWVTYTAISGPVANMWQSLDLTQNAADSTLWEGTLPLDGTPATSVRYVVQAVNGVGLVSLATNLGAYYTPAGEPDVQDESGVLETTTITLQSPPSTTTYGSIVTLRARLEDASGAGIAGETVTFILGAQQRMAQTNSDGVATVDLPVYAAPGRYDLKASFAGSDTYAASTTSAPFSVNKQPTTLSLLPSAASGVQGEPISIVATLRDGLGRPLREKSVFFVVSDDVNTYDVATISDYAGRAFLRQVFLPAGTYDVDAYFMGSIPLPGGTLTLSDALYQASSATGTLTLSLPTPNGSITVENLPHRAILTYGNVEGESYTEEIAVEDSSRADGSKLDIVAEGGTIYIGGSDGYGVAAPNEQSQTRKQINGDEALRFVLDDGVAVRLTEVQVVFRIESQGTQTVLVTAYRDGVALNTQSLDVAAAKGQTSTTYRLTFGETFDEVRFTAGAGSAFGIVGGLTFDAVSQ